MHLMMKIFYCGCGLGITLLVFINLETKYKLLWLLLLLKAQLCKSFTFLFSLSACENKLYRSFIPAFHSGDILSSLSPTVFGMLILSVSLKTLAILHLESLELSWRQKQKYQILQNAMLCLKQISGRRYITFNISCLWKLWIKNNQTITMTIPVIGMGGGQWLTPEQSNKTNKNYKHHSIIL